VVAYVPGPEIIAILQDVANKAATHFITLSIKEVIKDLPEDKRNALLSWFQVKGVRDFAKLLAIDLRHNPMLYSVFANESIYQKYVVSDEGDGILIIRPEATPLIQRAVGDAELYEFSHLSSNLSELMSQNNGVLRVIQISSNIAPENDDKTQWAVYMMDKRTKLEARYNEIRILLENFTNFRVKVRDFDSTIKQIIEKTTDLVRDASEDCSRALGKSGLDSFAYETGVDGLERASALLSMCLGLAGILHSLAAKWHVTIYSLSPSISKFMASVMRSAR
jgi:hypothetical protein